MTRAGRRGRRFVKEEGGLCPFHILKISYELGRGGASQFEQSLDRVLDAIARELGPDGVEL